MPLPTDEQIASALADTGGISTIEHEVWRLLKGLDVLRDADGNRESGFAINRKYNATTHTLRKWAMATRVAVGCMREKLQSGEVRWGHSIASGSDVRWSGDPTPARNTGGSSWNPERLKAAMAGTQRRQQKLPPKVGTGKGKRKERPAA